jgi:ATP/maltotriose-dependent transcriptional regulator MalT/DNA-binding SARP family transcriptional activator
VLPREGSLRLLRAALHRRLVLVQAAVGSGKSTLARLLARAGDAPVVRVRLDPRASDASFFFHQLLPALDLAEDEIDPQSAAPIETVRGLAAALDERPPFVLVLDEAEVLRESEPVLEMVARLAEHAPTGVSLLVLTSAPLDLPVDALRAREEFLELHDADLALEPSEAEVLLRELAPGAELEPDAIARLLRSARGRVGAVALFAVAIGDTDPQRLLDEIARAADAPVARLVDHVLARLEPAAADWLERAAVFDDLSLDAWGEADGASEAASLGLVDLTETPPSLASTVRGALRRRLRARPELWRETHARAARAWEAHGDREQAFHHWIEAGEIERAAQILSAIGYAVLTHDRIYALERLIQRLPAETIESDPLLLFCRGSVRVVRMQMDDACEDSRVAAELASAAGQRPLADAARSRLCFLWAWQGDFPAMAREAARICGNEGDLRDPVVLAAQAMLEMACRHLGRNEEADALAAEIDASSPQYPAALAVDNTRAMNARLAGDHATESRFGARCLAGARQGGVPGALLLGLLHTADAARKLGRPGEALEVSEEAAAVARSLRETWWEHTARNVRAAALRDLGRVEDARREARALIADCREHGGLYWVEGEVWLTLATLPDEDRGAALEAARRAAFARENPLLRAQVLTAIAREAERRGDARAAERELARAEEELGTVAAEELRSEMRLLRARMAIARGDVKQARGLLVGELREGPALRRERRALLPALVSLALRGDAKALAQVEAEGVAALPALVRARGRGAEALRARLLDAAAGPLDVESLGAFRVVRRGGGGADGESVRFRTPRVADLFRVLLLASVEAEAVPRDVLIEVLWPGALEAGGTFHTHLGQLRRALEPHLPPRIPSRYVLRSEDGYRLDLRGGSWDAERFRRDAKEGLAALRAGEMRRADAQLARAVALYRGPLFAEHLYVDAYADWRSEFARLFVESALAAADCARKLGDAERARAQLEHLVSLEPAEETVWRRLMEVAAERGRIEEIDRLLQRCRAALRAELDAEPSPATRALAAKLQQRPPPE